MPVDLGPSIVTTYMIVTVPGKASMFADLFSILQNYLLVSCDILWRSVLCRYILRSYITSFSNEKSWVHCYDGAVTCKRHI